jgi:hypothetical protein
MDPHWSETGDRYLLKLFRDYVFHQVDSSGKPIVDIGHVLRCLNKASLRLFISYHLVCILLIPNIILNNILYIL